MTPLIILDLAAKSLAILLLAFAVQAFWRRASASQRSLIWLVAFAGLLVVPLTFLIKPLWTPRVEALQTPRMPVLTQTVTVLPGASAQGAPTQVGQESLARRSRLSPLQVAGAVWLAGLLLVLAHRGLGSYRLRQLESQSSRCEEARIVQQVTDLAQSLGIRRPVSTLTSAIVSVPVTWGMWRPRLLLPCQVLKWNDEALLAALLHELGHIRHWDAASRWLATFACALHWWNPLAWIAARSWRTAQEQAADDFVLRSGSPAPDYAMQLLQAARSVQESRLVRAPLLAMARPATLETRLSAIMDTGRNRRRINRKNLLAAAMIVLVVLGGVSSMSLQGQPEKATEGSPKPSSAEAKQIAIAVRILEAPSHRLAEISDRNSVTILSSRDAEALVQTLRKDPLVKQIAYPRMVTHDRREVAINSKVNLPLPPGKPPLFIGSEMKVVPTLKEDRIHIAAAITSSSKIGEEKGMPVVSVRTIDTSVELDLGYTALFPLPSAENQPDMLVLITASIVAATSPVRDRAAKIILPRVQFSGATVDEAVEFLRVKARELGTDRKGINILVIGQPKATLSLDLKDIPMTELLKFVAQLSDQDLRFDSNAVVMSPRGFFARSVGLQPSSETAPIALKAASIITTRMDFRQALLGDVVSFIRADALPADPAAGSFNILLDERSPPAQKLITFHAENLSLLDLLHYIAILGDCTLTAEGTTFVLTPAKP